VGGGGRGGGGGGGGGGGCGALCGKRGGGGGGGVGGGRCGGGRLKRKNLGELSSKLGEKRMIDAEERPGSKADRSTGWNERYVARGQSDVNVPKKKDPN